MESYEKIKETNLYQAFRFEGYPTRYGDYQTNAFFNIGISGLVLAFVSIGISILFILPGFRGQERIFVAIRCITSLLIGLFIFLCNFESAWERAEVSASVQYKAGIGRHINASIGLNIGLRGINITLIGMPEQQIGERIKYNEHFSWQWDQGRPGFGPLAGQFHKEYRSSQYRGLPYPILWVAEYFTFDGEGIRFGRNYRLAGWYSHIMLWLAIPLYLLSNILFLMVIHYGALFLMMTGSALITANVLFSSIKNPIPLKIPFEQYLTHRTVYLEPVYSWCFYLNLFNGLFCVFLGIIAFFSDLRYPDETAEFFGIDVLQSYEDYFAEVKEFSNIKTSLGKSTEDKKEMEFNQQNMSRIYAGLRKKNFSNRLSRLQKSSVRKKPATQPRRVGLISDEESAQYANSSVETPLYENYQHFEPIGEEAEENQL